MNINLKFYMKLPFKLKYPQYSLLTKNFNLKYKINNITLIYINSKPIIFVLKSLLFVNLFFFKKLFNKLGLPTYIKLYQLTNKQLIILHHLLEILLINSVFILKRKRLLFLRNKILHTYKYIRFSKKLPSNKQRTRSNAKTVKILN